MPDRPKGEARDEELVQLRKEVADLRETNEILKKAMAADLWSDFTFSKGGTRKGK
ncbi:hypothetical protein AGMMS49991_08500 [Spirochaetia bacterium]|nr:hypothetical protein AGMMS49991_08500 [Spirochaetia bacterium]